MLSLTNQGAGLFTKQEFLSQAEKLKGLLKQLFLSYRGINKGMPSDVEADYLLCRCSNRILLLGIIALNIKLSDL